MDLGLKDEKVEDLVKEIRSLALHNVSHTAGRSVNSLDAWMDGRKQWLAVHDFDDYQKLIPYLPSRMDPFNAI